MSNTQETKDIQEKGGTAQTEYLKMTTEQFDKLMSNSEEKGRNEQLRLEHEELKKRLPFGAPTQTGNECKNNVGLMFRAIAIAKRAGGKDVSSVLKEWQSDPNTPRGYLNNIEQKAMQASTASGSWFLTGGLPMELIPALKELSIVRASGAKVLDMVQGQLKFRKEGTGAAAYWVGEGANITKSEYTGSQASISSSKLAALVVISNDLLRYASPELDSFVQEDIATKIAEQEDITFLRAAASATAPSGIATLMDAGNKFAMTAAPDATKIISDLDKMKLKLRYANIPMTNLWHYISPRVEYFLKNLKDSNGFYVFRDEMLAQKRLNGVQYKETMRIPENLGGGTETEIYLVDADQLIIGKDMDMELQVFENGTYHDGTNTVSGITTDETVVRAIMKTALGMRYAKAAAMLTGVTWGAV